MKKLSKKAEWLLFNLAAMTHPDATFVEWVENPDRNTTAAESELFELGLVKEINNESGGTSIVPTKAGIDFLKRSTDADELIKRIQNVIPRNPSFEIMAKQLTDTAVMGAIYALLGEIGRRGDPTNEAAYAYWNKKCADLESVLTNADPNSLWVRHTKSLESFKD